MKRFVFLLVLMLACTGAVHGQLAEMQKMSYQGFVTDMVGTPVPDGNYNLKVTIYNASIAGSALWTELHPGVQVTKGLFNIILGEGSPQQPLSISFATPRWIGIQIGTDPELTPRVRLTGVAHSFVALEAISVADGSITTAKLADAAVSTIKIADGALTTAKIADNAVTSAKIADNAVGNSELADAAVGTAEIAASAVTTAKIADGDVTTAKIADNAVTAAKIQPPIVSSISGVTNDGGDISLVAGTNVTITPNDGANTITIAATGGGSGLTLPWSGTTSASTNAFEVHNTGASSAADAILAQAAGGNAIEAINNSASVSALYVKNNGSGPVAEFGNFTSSAGDIVKITKNGGAGKGVNLVYGGTSNAVFIDNNSTGTGLELKQDGTGAAAYFHVDNTTTTANALRATTASTNVNSDALEAVAVAGNALDASNNSATVPTIIAYNGNASTNAPLIIGTTGTVYTFTVEKDGDITSSGTVEADTYTATVENGSSATPVVGTIYKDNIAHAWALVAAAGTVQGGFGMTSSRSATGTYNITYKNSVATASSQAPVVTVYEAASPQFAVISSRSTTGCQVKIFRFSAGAFSLWDSDFMIVVFANP